MLHRTKTGTIRVLLVGLVFIFIVYYVVSNSMKVTISEDIREPPESTKLDTNSLDSQINLLRSDRLGRLEFLPFGHTVCGKADAIPFSKALWKTFEGESQALLKTILKKGLKVNEGHSAQVPAQHKVYMKLASLSFVKTICETGFNAGHSTLAWLVARPDTKVYSFDLGLHVYAKKIATYLQERFPGRLNLTWGDSTKTLPKFAVDNPDVKCDLVIVDGGHVEDVANADLVNFQRMASPDNLLVFDDTQLKHIAHVWKAWKEKGWVKEIFECDHYNRGYAIAYYTNVTRT